MQKWVNDEFEVFSPGRHIQTAELSLPGYHRARLHKPVYLALRPSEPSRPQHPYDNPATNIQDPAVINGENIK